MATTVPQKASNRVSGRKATPSPPPPLTPQSEEDRVRHLIIFMKNIFFTIRTAKQWNRLHREAVQFLSLEVFKTQRDKAPSKLTWPLSSPCFSSRSR